MANIFQKISRKMDGIAFIVFVIAGAAIAIGLIGTVEDTTSSKLGLEKLMLHYDLELITYEFVALAIALAPQVGQVLFGYVYLADSNNKWSLWVALGFFSIDFVSDLYHRTSGMMGFDERTLVAGLFTLLYFTIGSEMFVTFGFGVLMEVSEDAAAQFNKFMRSLGVWLRGGKKPVHPAAINDIPALNNSGRNDGRGKKKKKGGGPTPLQMRPSEHNSIPPARVNERNRR